MKRGGSGETKYDKLKLLILYYIPKLQYSFFPQLIYILHCWNFEYNFLLNYLCLFQEDMLKRWQAGCFFLCCLYWLLLIPRWWLSLLLKNKDDWGAVKVPSQQLAWVTADLGCLTGKERLARLSSQARSSGLSLSLGQGSKRIGVVPMGWHTKLW